MDVMQKGGKMRLIDADALKEYVKIFDIGCGCDDDHHERFLDAIDDAPTIEQPHWISCSERQPEEYGNYITTMNYGDVQECTYSPDKNTRFMRGGWSTCESDGILFLDISEVIAWMPLPEPYKERREDG